MPLQRHLRHRPSGHELHPRCGYEQEHCRVEEPQGRPLSDGGTIRCHFSLVAWHGDVAGVC
jgi:ABC-type antimicrobial peptide transport system ATPase subunit